MFLRISVFVLLFLFYFSSVFFLLEKGRNQRFSLRFPTLTPLPHQKGFFIKINCYNFQFNFFGGTITFFHILAPKCSWIEKVEAEQRNKNNNNKTKIKTTTWWKVMALNWGENKRKRRENYTQQSYYWIERTNWKQLKWKISLSLFSLTFFFAKFTTKSKKIIF